MSLDCAQEHKHWQETCSAWLCLKLVNRETDLRERLRVSEIIYSGVLGNKSLAELSFNLAFKKY